MKLRILWRLLARTFQEWSADKASALGAALAYYALFSIAPLLILAIGIASLVFEAPEARREVLAQVGNVFGRPAAHATADVLNYTTNTGGGTVATVVGAVVLLFGASGVFVQLQDSLNTVWKVTPKPGRPWLRILRERALTYAVVLAAGVLLLVSLIVGTTLTAVAQLLPADLVPEGVRFWQAVHQLVAFVFTCLFFGLIYKYLPDVKLLWRDVGVGAVVTAVLFSAGKYLIALYLAETGTTSAFGAAGSVVLLLVWVYYSAQLFLLGAEFTRVWAEHRGRHIAPQENAVPVSAEQRTRQGLQTPPAQGA